MAELGHVAVAMRKVYQNAQDHINYRPPPDFAMLAQEMLELSLSLRGRHEHPPEYELVQMGGIILNWLANIEAAESGKVCDLVVENRSENQNGREDVSGP